MSNLLSQASLVMIPSGYKEDVVYSQIPTNGSGDLSFTRASNGTRVNSAGLVEVCPWNLLQQSGVFNVSPWAFVGGTTLTSGFSDVNGTLNAFRFQATSGSYKYGYQTISSTIGQVYTHSIYAKCSSGTQQLKLTDAQQGGGSLQTVTTEWQRFTFTLTASGGNIAIELGSDGTNALDIYICFAQTNIGSTAKPYFPTTDRLNVPRLTYQNGGGGCPSLLLEKQSTNLVTWSEDLSNADWTKGSVTITANNSTSPDGTQNADRVVETSAGGQHLFYENITVTNGATYTLTAFYKAQERTAATLQLADGASRFTALFDLSAGTILTTRSLGSPSGTSSSITNMGNGWYRCLITMTQAVGTTMIPHGALSNSNTPTWDIYDFPSYTGNTANGLLAWGFQLEASSYATSYIVSTSSSATRVADACLKTGATALIGQTEGVLFVDINYISHEAQSILVIEDWVANSTVIRILADTSTSLGAQVFQGGNQYTATFNSAVNGQRYKCALAYKANDFAFYVNGTQVSTSSSGTVPTTLNVRFGAFLSGQVMDGQINQMALFKTRLTNAELASLTTI